jgi:hypothetical protein
MSAHEIDMIPASYRERFKIRRWCHLFLLALGAVILLTLLIRFTLNSKNQSIQTEISTLQQDKSFNQQQQQTYNNLLTSERKLNKKLGILDGLRGGAPVRQTMMVIDRVLNDNVWFLQWSFKRAGEIVNLPPQTKPTGYFIIISPENSRIGKQQTWKLETHMEVKGQARDHSSFSLFVQDLLNQTEIEDVKIVNTQMRRYAGTQIIDFNIVIVINNQLNKPHV